MEPCGRTLQAPPTPLRSVLTHPHITRAFKRSQLMYSCSAVHVSSQLLHFLYFPTIPCGSDGSRSLRIPKRLQSPEHSGLLRLTVSHCPRLTPTLKHVAAVASSNHPPPPTTGGLLNTYEEESCDHTGTVSPQNITDVSLFPGCSLVIPFYTLRKPRPPGAEPIKQQVIHWMKL